MTRVTLDCSPERKSKLKKPRTLLVYSGKFENGRVLENGIVLLLYFLSDIIVLLHRRMPSFVGDLHLGMKCYDICK